MAAAGVSQAHGTHSFPGSLGANCGNCDVCLDSAAVAGALSPSLALPFCLQIINFREPVTLDFLDAELEDENKEEVGRLRGSFWGTGCTCPLSAVAKGT